MEKGMEKGLLKGISQGIEDRIGMVVRAMKEKGFPIDMIAGISGWSEEKVRNS
ncbi:MAG: hypothetical protein NC115_07085 [Bacteroidales bacterium]|nr:hypothetical protein [Bacteroides sp.]MCM1199170.1 hypothetical protein [Clostridium sp.]MCM1502415.1 hypothetical protein [Bacteroidales bacterium]